MYFKTNDFLLKRFLFLILFYISLSSFINGSVEIIGLILFLFILVFWKKKSNTPTNELDEWKKKERHKGKKERTALLEYEKSEYYAKRDELDKVIFHLTNAININPIGKYYGSRGKYKKSKEDYDGALEDFNKAISLLPDSSFFWYCRAQIFFTIGNLENAYLNWKKSEELGSVGAKNALQAFFKDYNTNNNKKGITKESDFNLNGLRSSWINYNEYLILQNDTLLDLLDKNPVESINYSILLSCFEWKFKRFKILVRDNFECQDCNEKSNKLHVHHTYYLKDSMPWEIDDSALISLCRDCHTKRHEKEIIKVYNKINGQLIITNHYYLNCSRCNGTGYLPQYKYVDDGICYQCYGNVLSKAIFIDRLNVIKLSKEKYDINLEKNSLRYFMRSITVE